MRSRNDLTTTTTKNEQESILNVKRERGAESGERGERGTRDGEREMGNGQWGTGNGERKSENE